MHKLLKHFIQTAVDLESRWFDLLHGVDTRPAGGLPTAAAPNPGQNFEYLPTRPSAIRPLLRNLPLREHGSYTFVDFGSGKGRVVLLASELPFAGVQGVELSPELHACAVRNLSSGRFFWRRARRIECLNKDATEYIFPETNLVLYFYNPFDLAIMRRVLVRLRSSWQECPRDVVLIFSSMEYNPLPEIAGWTEPVLEVGHSRIYRLTARH